MDNEKGWRRLASAVRKRRDEQGWTQLDVATRGGLSIDRIQAIEGVRTDSYAARTLAKLDRGLGWQTGSSRALVDVGAEPMPADDQPAEREPSALDMQAELRARLERIAANPDRLDMLRKFAESIDPGETGSASQAG